MIIKKDIIGGREVFVEIDKDKAKDEFENGAKLYFTTEDEEDDFYDFIEDKEDEDDINFSYKNHNKYNKIEDKIEKNAKKIAANEMEFAKNLSNTIQKGCSFTVNEIKKNKKNRNIANIFPFMREDDLHSFVTDLLNDDEKFKSFDFISLAPFLNKDDCDKIFMKKLKMGLVKDIVTLAPFVSKEVLSMIVDLYIARKLKNININALYPFLSKEDIKRIFKYMMENDE